ncbi:PREDICTED: dentin sialophosphoprotein-like [Lupinus angustifolius]|uniref:dentin sialophosphoprotein-like n=1 Tax=Lupinus angustifolius TaxID=3871 RepID=UPI00092FB228|nr:PREDICTED: dentin sialophosphoprotein-like [Lupinus angustifolius]
MGNEMGNNNTSTIKEEDNISEAEKKTLSQDTSEVENGVSEDVDADSANKEIQPTLTSIGKDDAIENAAEASNDATTEPGKDTWKEDNHADDVKGNIQTVSTAESKDVQENDTYFASRNTSMNSFEGDTRASDTSMKNQMHPTTEAEYVQEKHTILASDCSAIENEEDTLHADIYADDVKEKIHMIPTDEAKDVEEEATEIISKNTESMLENDSLEGDTNSSNVSMENQMHPESEAEDEDVPEKPTGLDSEYYTISLFRKDLLKGDIAYADDNNVDHEKQPTPDGKDDQEIASKLGFDDKTSESQDQPQEDKQDADVVILMANGIDVQGKDTILASDDLLNSRTCFDGTVHVIPEGRQPEKSLNTGPVDAEDENHEMLSSFSLEGSEEHEKRNKSCLTKPLLITHDLLDNNEPSIKQGCEYHHHSHGFGKLSMGNEMGNNNTSTIKEEDNISEAEKKTLSQDTSEVENGVSEDVDADSANKEIQPTLTSIGKDDAIENAAEASNDATTEPGKDTYFASRNTSMNSFEGDTRASDTSMKNQMHPTTEAEYVQEKHTILASDCSAIENEEDTLHADIYADDVKEKIHMIPTDEAKDVEEEATEIISKNTESMLENDSLEGDTNSSNVSMENQMHPESEAEDEDVPEKPTGLDSEYYTISLFRKDLLKGDIAYADDNNVDHEKQPTPDGKDDQEIASKLGFDDKTSESQDQPQEDKQDADVVILMANGIDVQGKDTILASDDLLNSRTCFDGTVHVIPEGRQPEKSLNTGPVDAEDENHEMLSSFSLEGSEEHEKRNKSCLTKPLLITHDLLDNNEPSIKQADTEETTVSTLNSVHVSNDSELQEPPNVHSDHDEHVEVLSEESHQGSVSLIKDNFIDTNSHVEQIKDETSEKEIESEEKLLWAENSASRDGNEFGSDSIESTGITSDSPSIGNKNGNILTKFNYITTDSLISLPESFVVDNTLKSNHEENGKVIRDESITCYSYNCSLDRCKEETLEEFKASIVDAHVVTAGSNGDYNGESNTVPASDVSWISNTDEVEEPKVGEGGIQFDAHVNNCKPSDETNFVSEPEHSVVPEAEMVSLIGGSNVVDCRHKSGENYKTKMDETNGKSEASYADFETSEGTEISEECNSDLVTSNVTVPSLDLVDDESFENEGEIYSLHIESTSLKEAKLTSSAATMSSEEPCSNNSIFASGGYETREMVTRFSTESESDNPNFSSLIQKSPSFNLNLQIEVRPEESDQAPLKLEIERIPNQASLNLINNSMPNVEYGKCMLQNEEVAVEEKIVTMERSYSEKYNHSGAMKDVKEVLSTSPKGKEKRRARSSFFSTCMCCTTVAN